MLCCAAQVDAFADGPGSGNPAGVCLLTGEQLSHMSDDMRQKVAAKVNLSETAFIEPVGAMTGTRCHDYCCRCQARQETAEHLQLKESHFAFGI